jgi:hypothetical protein
MTPEEYLNTALADGWSNIHGWGFVVTYKQHEYDSALAWFTRSNASPSYEDILTKIIEMDGTLHFKDMEGDMSVRLTKDLLHTNIKKVPTGVLRAIEDMEYDAYTTDEFLQYILFKEITFG